MSFFKILLSDLKTYYKINAIYPKRYKDSKIESYIVNENILGKNLNIRKDVFISDTLKKIGDGTYIGNRSEILNCSEIGQFCSISHDVKIGLDNHNLDFVSTNSIFCPNDKKMRETKSSIIENDVLISANVMIISGVKIGNGAIIGAGAFVNKDVPPYAIVAGIPAKIIKYRFDEQTIEKLLKSEWWNFSPEKIKELSPYFTDIRKFLEKI